MTTRYCGRDVPPDGVYDGPVVVGFHSDNSYSAAGFLLRIQLPYTHGIILISNSFAIRITVTTKLYTNSYTLPLIETSSTVKTTTVSYPEGCSVRRVSGNVTTTNYPQQYPDNDEWCLVIEGEVTYAMVIANKDIHIHFDVCLCICYVHFCELSF